MAYERDSDRRTRGAGAIAAADLSAGTQQRARVRVGQATRSRDRVMAAVANGALGAINFTGATKLSSTPKIPVVRKPAASTGNPFSKVLAPSAGFWAPGTPGLPVAPAPPRVKPITTYDPTDRPPLTQAPTPVSSLPPIPPVPAVPSGGGAATGGSAGGGKTMSGGGSSVITTGGASPGLNLPDLQPLPDASAPADHMTRNLLIAGGVGLAAYFLIFRRKS